MVYAHRHINTNSNDESYPILTDDPVSFRGIKNYYNNKNRSPSSPVNPLIFFSSISYSSVSSSPSSSSSSTLGRCFSNKYCVYTLVTIMTSLILFVFTTAVAVMFVKFLHYSAQCSNLSLTNSDTVVLKFESFVPSRVRKLSFDSHGITKIVIKRSPTLLAESQQQLQLQTEDTLVITVNRYSQSSTGYKNLNVSLQYDYDEEEENDGFTDGEKGHLRVITDIPKEYSRNDCVFVEMTVSLPSSMMEVVVAEEERINFSESDDSSISSSSSSSGNLQLFINAGVGDVEFLKHKEVNEKETSGEKDKKFRFKSVQIERHSGDILLDSVHCTQYVNISTHHGQIHIYDVSVQHEGIIAQIMSEGSLIYENLYTPMIRGIVQNKGDIKGQFIYGNPTLNTVRFETQLGSQSHTRVVNASTQSYHSNYGNVHLIMRPFEFQGSFALKAKGSVLVDHFSQDQITFSMNGKSEKRGTIQFQPVKQQVQQIMDGGNVSLEISVAKKGNINVMLDV